MAKAKIKQVKNVFNLTFTGLTAGELLALKNSLEMRKDSSPVARDVLHYLLDADGLASTEPLKDLIK